MNISQKAFNGISGAYCIGLIRNDASLEGILKLAGGTAVGESALVYEQKTHEYTVIIIEEIHTLNGKEARSYGYETEPGIIYREIAILCSSKQGNLPRQTVGDIAASMNITHQTLPPEKSSYLRKATLRQPAIVDSRLTKIMNDLKKPKIMPRVTKQDGTHE